jgi:H+/Cl- antiporter ClcA
MPTNTDKYVRPTAKGELIALLSNVGRWIVIGSIIGILSGVASAVFLLSLDAASRFRDSHGYMLFLLPVAGAVIGLIYASYGKSVDAGNNLVLENVHNPDATIPFRMAPLVLITTVATHLFGGSAGREGTAVQMGGALAAALRKPFSLSRFDYRIAVMSGISGGFGSVFGTPIAGTIFGLEVLTLGRMSYEALLPCFVASVVGDIVCRGIGVKHHAYAVHPFSGADAKTWLLLIVAGALCAAASAAFSELTHAISGYMKKHFSAGWLRPVIGGVAVIGLTLLLNTRAYLGLGLPLIEQSFTPSGVPLAAFALKILFTAITLGTGFKGGEVTPLFCIGATLGAAIAHLTGQHADLFAAVCFVGVFSGAANTPLACIAMGIELFGASLAVPIAAVCIVSYLLSGHRGIYLSQRVHTPKADAISGLAGITLRDHLTGRRKS